MTEPSPPIADPSIAMITEIVRSISDLITRQPSLIAVDVCDLRAVLGRAGTARFGSGEAAGTDRAVRAARQAIGERP